MDQQNRLNGASVLLTGATGLIGGEILQRLLDSPVDRVYCLVRRTNGIAAEDRLLDRLGPNRSGDLQRVIPIVGDMTSDALGLSPSIVNELRARVSVVIHSAGETSFIKHRECQRVNIFGLQNLLELASTFKQKTLFAYFSSAAACGDRRQTLLCEDDYPLEQDSHFVDYTKTKALAERVLLEQQSISDWLILRPSIVVPDKAVPDKHLRGILWALVLMNEVSFLPLSRTSDIDAVPLSFVGECAIRLIGKPDRQHKCYHISAGRRFKFTWGDVIKTMKETFGRDTEIQCLDVSQWESVKHRLTRHERMLVGAVSSYFPFINQSVLFDNQRLFTECTYPSPQLQDFREYLPGLLKKISVEEALRESENP